MTPDDISRRLQEAAKQRTSDIKQDRTVEKLSRVLMKLDPVDQMMAITAYQASLILEIADMDRDAATSVFRASMALCGTMMHDMADLVEKAPNEIKH